MYNDPAAETFGSVYYPQENGGGSRYYGRGGGTVRIVADRVQVDGVDSGQRSDEQRRSAGRFGVDHDARSWPGWG